MKLQEAELKGRKDFVEDLASLADIPVKLNMKHHLLDKSIYQKLTGSCAHLETLEQSLDKDPSFKSLKERIGDLKDSAQISAVDSTTQKTLQRLKRISSDIAKSYISHGCGDTLAEAIHKLDIAGIEDPFKPLLEDLKASAKSANQFRDRFRDFNAELAKAIQDLDSQNNTVASANKLLKDSLEKLSGYQVNVCSKAQMEMKEVSFEPISSAEGLNSPDSVGATKFDEMTAAVKNWKGKPDIYRSMGVADSFENSLKTAKASSAALNSKKSELNNNYAEIAIKKINIRKNNEKIDEYNSQLEAVKEFLSQIVEENEVVPETDEGGDSSSSSSESGIPKTYTLKRARWLLLIDRWEHYFHN